MLPGNPYELPGGPGHITSLVVTDTKDAVGPGVVKGIEVQPGVLQQGLARGTGGLVRGHEHLGIECDSHAFAA